MTKLTDSVGSELGLDLSEKEIDPGRPRKGRGVRVALVSLACLYVIVFPIVTAIVVVTTLQASDRVAAESIVRMLLFPFGDFVIFAQGISQAFIGHLTDPVGAESISGLAVVPFAAVLGIVHVGIVGMLIVAVNAIARRARVR